MPSETSLMQKRINYYKYIILLMVIAFMGMAFYCAFHNQSRTQDTKPSQLAYPLLDPAREVVPQENYLINIQPLRDYLRSLGEQYGADRISIYYEQINSGANISVHKNARFFPASLPKLPIAIVAMKKIEDGIWSDNTKLKVLPEDISSGSGQLFKTAANQELMIKDLLQALLIDSDNTAQGVLLRNLTQDELERFKLETGLEDLFDSNGYVSAKEYTRILRVLYTSSFLKPENSEKILQLLVDANFTDYLSQGLPKDVRFAHKYGENKDESIFGDSGIVYYDGRPYMITVLLKGEDSTEKSREWAMAIMKDISEHAFQMDLKK